ncbi:MAG: hypothetical protein KF819_23775 [Labilithrix sp.]|nr:hypothetical protein [Labilithrix sp.]
MTRRRSTCLSCGLLGVVAAASCRDPTEVKVVITTGEKCADMSRVQTVVASSPLVTQERFQGRYTTAQSDACGADGFVGTLVITPGGATGSILVAAGVRVGGEPPPDAASCAQPEIAKRCIIARRAFAFISNTSLSLPIRLDPLCVGKPCDPATTCFKGACVDATVTCNGAECGLPQERPGEGNVDGGSFDGAYDADLDAPGFEDASFDAPDGTSVVDGGPDAAGADSGFPSCGNVGTGSPYCYAPANGTTTAGPCPAGAGAFCCQCACGSMAARCEPGGPAMSCRPNPCP